MQWFNIELLGNVIASERTATAGDHRSLDYIPASALQGVLASRAYQQLSKPDADKLVLLGAVQFSDALPMFNGEIGLPVPLAWHKDKAKGKAGVFIPSLLQGEGALAGVQPQQLRTGYVTPSKYYFAPAMTRHTKTAIDPETGTVASGQLFNYQSINRGQNFMFAVQASSDVQALLEGEAAIGRSRSAEFGRVRITACKAPIMPASSAQANTVLMLSDCAVVDQYGQPSANPNHLGLGQVNIAASYLRSRSRTRYNQFFRSHLADEQLIEAGTCLSLSSAATVSGLAFHHGALVLAGCDWLSQAEHTLAAEPVVQSDNSAVQHTALTNLLAKRTMQQQTVDNATAAGQALYRQYIKLLAKADAYLGGLDAVPGKSQFGELRRLGQEGKALAKVSDELLATQDKKNSWGWALAISPHETLAEGFIEHLAEINAEHFSMALERFAQKCSRTTLETMLADATRELTNA